VAETWWPLFILVDDTILVLNVASFKVAAVVTDDTMMFVRRNDAPDSGTLLVVQELVKLIESNPAGLTAIDPVKDLHIHDLDLVQDLQRLKHLRQTLPLALCIQLPNFIEKVRKTNLLSSLYIYIYISLFVTMKGVITSKSAK